MEPRGNGEVSRSSDGNLGFRQSTAAISSLNEAWCRALDEYAVDMPLNEVLLPLLRNCFFWRSSLRAFVAAKGSWRSARCRYRRLHYRRAVVLIAGGRSGGAVRPDAEAMRGPAASRLRSDGEANGTRRNGDGEPNPAHAENRAERAGS